MVAVLYGVIGAATVAVVLGTVRSRSRSGTAGGRVHDMLEAAFLAGGPGRVADTVICGMHADGRVAVGAPGVLAVLRPVARDPAEQALLDVHARFPHGALPPLRAALMRSPAVQQIGDRLAARGMLVPPAVARRWNRAGKALLVSVWLCFATVFVTDVIRAQDVSPTDGSGLPLFLQLLPALLVSSVAGGRCARVSRRRITRAGRRALAAYTRTTSFAEPDPGDMPWRRRPEPADPAPAGAAVVVALGGAAALDDLVLRDQLLQAQRTTATSAVPGTSPITDPGALPSVDGGFADPEDPSEPAWCGACDSGSSDSGSSGSGCGTSCGASSSCGGGSGGSSCGGGSGCGGGGGGCGGGS